MSMIMHVNWSERSQGQSLVQLLTKVVVHSKLSTLMPSVCVDNSLTSIGHAVGKLAHESLVHLVPLLRDGVLQPRQGRLLRGERPCVAVWLIGATVRCVWT